MSRPELLPFAPPGHLDPQAVAAALRRLDILLLDGGPERVAVALALAARVSAFRLHGFQDWYTIHGNPDVRIRVRDVYRQAGGYRRELGCLDCGEGLECCVHTAAVRLALAWNSPEQRAWLEAPAWRSLLAPLASALPRPRAELAAGAEGGWIRYALIDPSIGLVGLSNLDGVLERELVRASKKTGAPLAPTRFPRSIQEAGARVRLTPLDLEIERYFTELRALDAAFRRDWRGPDARTSSLIEDLITRALNLLPDVPDLRFRGEPVKADATPLLPRIEVEDGPNDTITLRWRPSIRAVWDLGPGFVLTAEGVFRPLHPDVPHAAVELLEQRLPSVPLSQAGEFLREVVLKSPLPVDLAAHNLPHLRGAKITPQPRLRVTEEDRGLKIEACFLYSDADHVREVPAGDTSPWVVLGEVKGAPRLAERETELEARALALLGELVPGPLPARLEGDAALAFLYELATEGTAVRSAWEVLFDERLAKIRSAGRMTPQLSVNSGIDWFEVDIEFRGLAKARAELGTLIEAWRAGRRFVRLGSGQIGRIPTEWLARHALALEQLAEVQKAGGGKLRAFAAPLAADLLGEEGLPPAVQRWRAIGERVRAFERVPEWPLPEGVEARLRDYQLRGFHWLVWLRDLDLGGVLADDMGLGKTLQVLALLLDTHAEPGGPPSLVVAPTSVVHGWVSEAARFVPELRVALHHGPGRGEDLPDADVVVTSYALLRQDDELFGRRRFRYVVLDEAQAIKNPTSQLAQACQALQADHRLAVTGTPLENNLVELWSLFQFLMPGFFGGRTAFNARFTTPIQKYKDDEAMAGLRARIRPFVLRRRKDEVARELPPRTEQVLYCELDASQRRLYESVKDTYRDQVLNKVKDEGVGRATIQILEALTRLRQACCDPRLLPFDEARAVSTSAKRTLLIDTLDEIVAEGHRTLIFSQWPSLLKLVEADLKAGHVGYLYLDGATTDRKSLVERWNEPDGPPVFLISLKAGGTGLNLTGADHVIHLDPWWNPAVEAQATDRAHRIGQTKPVVVYKLVARDTVEEKILELQARKKALFDAAVDADRMLVDTLTRSDLEAVFAPANEAR